MRLKFKINMSNVTEHRDSTKEKLKLVLWKAMLKMEELAKQKAPVDTGNLKQKIHITPSTFGFEKYTLSDGTDYGIHMEFGTKPHWVPISPLKEWSRRVLGDEKAAYAVRNKIKKYGVNAKPFFRPASHEVRIVWLPRFKESSFGRT